MYYIHTITDTISIPPQHMGEEPKKVAEDILRKKYERVLDRDMGIIIAVFNISGMGSGFVVPGDPNVHMEVTFDALTFAVEVDEVVVGEVSELVDFGCFVRIGPIDGLVHLSQITTDFMSYDKKGGFFSSRSSGRSLKKGDLVYAKVSSVSMKNSIKDIKIALTMRPEGLGKPEWLRETKPRERQQNRRGRGKPRR